jgi:serine/threonine-protein kinase
LKLLDFGIARSERQAADTPMPDGVVLGTPAYMAPEQVFEHTHGSIVGDVYAAGLVLFELLGQGPLFPGDAREQLRGRIENDPDLASRVPEPLLTLLTRMLARAPDRRFPDATHALAAIANLETAPVPLADLALGEEMPLSAPIPMSKRPPPQHALDRIFALPEDPLEAFDSALAAIDIPMLDALARREREGDIGRIARAATLAMRLELDAAALLLEPRLSHPLARGIAASLVAPRARKSTRARLETEDDWVDALPAELAGHLISIGIAMMTFNDAGRHGPRAERLAQRATSGRASVSARLAAHSAPRIAGSSRGRDDVAGFLRIALEDPEPDRLTAVTRSLALAALAFRADDHVAREHFERAAMGAAESGATLVEVRALLGWGAMLLEIPQRRADGMHVLERATTILENADAPALEHLATHNRGVALLIDGNFEGAARMLRRARIAAKGTWSGTDTEYELPPDHAVLSGMGELLALLATDSAFDAAAALAELADDRLSGASARVAALARCARSLYAIRFETLDRAQEEVRRALRAAESDQLSDAHLFTEVLQILYETARGEPVDVLARASRLEAMAQDRGLAGFYWLGVLRAVLDRIPSSSGADAMKQALERVSLLLAPLAPA